MKGSERREKIIEILKSSKIPVKGGEISKILDVSRQIIVQDVALLRAESFDIISTPQGYIINKTINNNTIRRVIAVKHNKEQIEDELKTIILNGGKVIDVTIEHKVYGEITGKLMIKSMYDIDQFMNKLNDNKPLLFLTEGVHIHTIEAYSLEDMQRILKGLSDKGYLIEKE